MAAISVLCPTRRRAAALERSVGSLRAHATDDFELLLAVDSDDETDYGAYENVLRFERRGYARLHEYYNALAARASGDWLLVWNDDAVMATPRWDEVVRPFERSYVLSPRSVHAPLCTFPFVPRRFADAVGHFSLNSQCDAWWDDIACRLGILRWIPVDVEHERADLTGLNDDETYAERDYQSEAFWAADRSRARDADVVVGLL